MVVDDGAPPIRLDVSPAMDLTADLTAGLAAGTGGPLRVKSAADQLVDRLVTAIALGVLLPGQKLPPEREFASRLDVSRTTLRDAIHQLELMGYLTIRRGRSGGARINSAWGPESSSRIRQLLLPRWRQLLWLFDLTKVLLPTITRLAAHRRTAEDLAEIRTAVRAYEAARDRDALRVADHAIHRAIAAATGNPYYVSLDSQLRSHLTFGTGSLPYDEDIRRRALGDHRALAEAIGAGDADRAADLAYRHFVELAEEPMLRLRERVVSGEPADPGSPAGT